jgi:hypothetical protein
VTNFVCQLDAISADDTRETSTESRFTLAGNVKMYAIVQRYLFEYPPVRSSAGLQQDQCKKDMYNRGKMGVCIDRKFRACSHVRPFSLLFISTVLALTAKATDSLRRVKTKLTSEICGG